MDLGMRTGRWVGGVIPGCMLRRRCVYDEAVGATYTYDRVMREFVNFDTPGMVARKLRFLKSQGLGGITLWEVSMDRADEGSLVETSQRFLLEA
jgi:chitinase